MEKPGNGFKTGKSHSRKRNWPQQEGENQFATEEAVSFSAALPFPTTVALSLARLFVSHQCPEPQRWNCWEWPFLASF